MKLRPLYDRLLVTRTEEQHKTTGGLFIPDSAKEKPMEARVVAVEVDVVDRVAGAEGVAVLGQRIRLQREVAERALELVRVGEALDVRPVAAGLHVVGLDRAVVVLALEAERVVLLGGAGARARALLLAERATFLEKGQVRFEGSTDGLMERGDLARAVFFGTEGG